MGRKCSTYVERRCAYRALEGKPEGRRPLGRHMLRLEKNIKIDLQKVGWKGIDWIYLTQDRNRCPALMNMVMNLRVLYNAGNFWSTVEPVSFSGETLLRGLSRSVSVIEFLQSTPYSENRSFRVFLMQRKTLMQVM